MGDEAGVRALFARLTEAWNRGDGVAYGECFTEDATYVAWVGTVYRGGEDIGRTHQVLFDTFLKDTKITTEAEPEVRFYGQDVAVMTTRGDVGKKAKTPTKVQTTTVVRQNGEWVGRFRLRGGDSKVEKMRTARVNSGQPIPRSRVRV